MSRRTTRREREQYAPTSRHDARPTGPMYAQGAPANGDEYVALDYVCRLCGRPLWTFCRYTFPGADARTWVQPRTDQGALPPGWCEDWANIHIPCADCRTDPQLRKETIDAQLATLAARPDGPRRVRVPVA